MFYVENDAWVTAIHKIMKLPTLSRFYSSNCGFTRVQVCFNSKLFATYCLYKRLLFKNNYVGWEIRDVLTARAKWLDTAIGIIQRNIKKDYIKPKIANVHR